MKDAGLTGLVLRKRLERIKTKFLAFCHQNFKDVDTVEKENITVKRREEIDEIDDEIYNDQFMEMEDYLLTRKKVRLTGKYKERRYIP